MAKKNQKRKIKSSKKRLVKKARRSNISKSAVSVKIAENKKKTKKEDVFDKVHRTKIRVIGIGGGGGSIVSEIISRIKKASFVVANTDVKALKLVKGAKHFQFGKELTNGLGTGMRMEIGEEAAKQDKEKIKKIFEGQDICIIISCLGGGTGGGAAPIFAKIAKDLNCLTYGIFTLPFEFEGKKKMEIAKEALLKIRPYLNIYSVIPNERIFQIIDKNTPLKQALSAINKQMAENLKGLIEMIYLPGLINIDFADLKTILTGRGRLAYLKKIEIKEKELEREEMTKMLISSWLYPYTFQGARAILYNITGGKDLRLSDVSKISRIIFNSLNKKARVIFGISQHLKKQAEIGLTILAVGCSIKGEFLKPEHLLKNKAKTKSSSSLKISKTDQEKTKEDKLKAEQKIKENKIEESKTLFSESSEKSEEKKKDAVPQLLLEEGLAIEASKINNKININDKINKKGKIGLLTAGLKSKKMKTSKKDLPPVLKRKKKPIESKIKEKAEERSVKQKSLVVKKEELYDKKIRRNALQVRKAAEEEERKLLEEEKKWETPAIFRRKNNKSNTNNL